MYIIVENMYTDGWMDGCLFTCIAVLGQIDGDLTADSARSSHDEGYGLLDGHFLELFTCKAMTEGEELQ